MAPVAVQSSNNAFHDSLKSLHQSGGTHPQKAKQPYVVYHPDYDQWQARSARRLAEDPSLPKTELPVGLPKKLESPLVWEGSDWKGEGDWVYDLSPDQLQEIDDAVTHFNSESSNYQL